MSGRIESMQDTSRTKDYLRYAKGLKKRAPSCGVLLLILIVAIAVRIPRVPYVQGRDMFVLATESFSLINGNAVSWLIHPLSFLGMFAFSGYPIGSVALFASMLILTGSSLETATMLFVSLFCIVSVISTSILMRHLFPSRTLQMLGTVLYQFVPIVYEFTYNTASARMPLLALLPLFVYLLLQWNRGSRRALAQAIAVVLLLLLFHRASIALFGLVAVAVLYPYVMQRIRRLPESKNIPTGQFMVFAFIMASALILVLGFLTFGIYPKNVIPADMLPSSVPDSTRMVISVCLDYSLFYGPLLVLSGIGLLGLLLDMWHSVPEWGTRIDEWGLLLFVFLPLSYFIAYPAYTRHFAAIFVVALSVRGMKHLQGSLLKSLVGIVLCVLPSLIYFNLYNLFWRPIGPYAELVTVSSVLLSILYVLAPRGRKTLDSLRGLSINQLQIRALMIALMVLIVAISYIDMRTALSGGEFPARVPTEEEIDVAEFIRQDLDSRIAPSIVISQHVLVELRVAAYAQAYALADGHGISLLAVGYLSRDDALKNSTLKGLEGIMNTHVYEHPVRAVDLWYEIMGSNWTESKTQALISDLRISHFVALKDIDECFGPFGAARDAVCVLSRTISMDPIYETEHFIVYSFNT